MCFFFKRSLYLFGLVGTLGVAVAEAHILAGLHDLEVARMVGAAFAGRLDVVDLPAHSSRFSMRVLVNYGAVGITSVELGIFATHSRSSVPHGLDAA